MPMPSCALCALCALCKLEVLACHKACEIWRPWRNLKNCLIASYHVPLYHSKDTQGHQSWGLSRVTWNCGILLGVQNESESSSAATDPGWFCQSILSELFGTLAGENPASCCLWQRLVMCCYELHLANLCEFQLGWNQCFFSGEIGCFRSGTSLNQGSMKLSQAPLQQCKNKVSNKVNHSESLFNHLAISPCYQRLPHNFNFETADVDPTHCIDLVGLLERTRAITKLGADWSGCVDFHRFHRFLKYLINLTISYINSLKINVSFHTYPSLPVFTWQANDHQWPWHAFSRNWRILSKSLRRLKERLAHEPQLQVRPWLANVREKQNGFCQRLELQTKFQCILLLNTTESHTGLCWILTGWTRPGKAAVSRIGCFGTYLSLCSTKLLNLHLIYLIYFDTYIYI